ncbi:MAG: hypothetical protein ACREBQ_12960 [Nitrososphaerales archaeon]
MQLAFYKGWNDKIGDVLLDAGIRFRQWCEPDMHGGARYSHVELVFDDAAIPTNASVDPGDPIGLASVCFSATIREKGVRFKFINLHDDKWDLLPIPHSAVPTLPAQQRMAKYATSLCGRPYNVPGILHYVIPFVEPKHGEDYCSQVVSLVLERGGALTGPRPAFVSPAGLYVLVQREWWTGNGTAT